VLTVFSASTKHAYPFRWVGWYNTTLTQRGSSKEPKLKVYIFNTKTVGHYDTIAEIIRKEKKSGDQLFTFPCLPLFNYLTDLPQPSFSLIHYWDVCPDTLAESDAAIIAHSWPRFLVEMELNEDHWKIHEDRFRKGRKSGQRIMHETLRDLTSSGQYYLAYEAHTAGWKFPVRLGSGGSEASFRPARMYSREPVYFFGSEN